MAVRSEGTSPALSEIPVVILAGGLGTRLREETAFRPKPMVEVGGRPILWHIMKIYDHFGFRGSSCPWATSATVIKDYFLALCRSLSATSRSNAVRRLVSTMTARRKPGA